MHLGEVGSPGRDRHVHPLQRGSRLSMTTDGVAASRQVDSANSNVEPVDKERQSFPGLSESQGKRWVTSDLWLGCSQAGCRGLLWLLGSLRTLNWPLGSLLAAYPFSELAYAVVRQ